MADAKTANNAEYYEGLAFKYENKISDVSESLTAVCRMLDAHIQTFEAMDGAEHEDIAAAYGIRNIVGEIAAGCSRTLD